MSIMGNADLRICGFAAVLLLSFGVPSAASMHPCSGEARAKARALLAFHFGEDDRVPLEVGTAVDRTGTVRALRKEGDFDVLQVWGHVYKADYRMRFIYAQVQGTCILMGQEILEAGSPY